jgi:hypothetical protein
MKINDTWCPLSGTNYEGYCVDNTAVIEVRTSLCDHKDDCLKLKEDLDKKSQNENQPVN